MAPTTNWTVMVYLGGDNKLSPAGEKDLVDMSRIGSTAKVNVVAQFDRIGDDHHSERYYVRHDDVSQVADLGETDSGDPDVLLDFIGWAAENYPAERYALVLWNHGVGWLLEQIDRIARAVGARDYSVHEATARSRSPLGRVFFRSAMQTIFSLPTPADRAICSDEGSGYLLDTIDLGRALGEAVGKLGQPIDLLGMDGCLMSSLEMAYQVRPYVRYMVASEEMEPPDGWPYDTVLRELVAHPDMPTAALAARFVEAYVKSYGDEHYPHPVTQSALNLAKAEELTHVLDDLADVLIKRMPEVSPTIFTAQRKSAHFYQNTLWDISHFCTELASLTTYDAVRRAAQKVPATLEPGSERFVIFESHRGARVDRCGGVAVYMPPLMNISRYYADLDYAKDHLWLTMLKAYQAG